MRPSALVRGQADVISTMSAVEMGTRDFRDELPFNDTGKLLRRVLRDELAATFA